MQCFLFIIFLSFCSHSQASGSSIEERYHKNLFTLGMTIFGASEVSSKEDLKSFYFLNKPNEAIDNAFSIRNDVRKAVSKWKSADKVAILEHYNKYPSYISIYSAFILENIGPPPRFKPNNYQGSIGNNSFFKPIFKSRNDYSKLLLEIYASNKIENLWTRLESKWMKAQPTTDHVDKIKSKVLKYMRLTDKSFLGQLPNYRVILNPLVTPGNGGNIFLSQMDAILTLGPNVEQKTTDIIIAHESMHQPVNLLFRNSTSLKLAFENTECAMKKVKENRGYTEWWNYATEAMIRAASHRLMENSFFYSGFLYERFFYDDLEKYESDNTQSFEAYLAQAVVRLKKKTCNKDP